MPGLAPGIHAAKGRRNGVDGRHKTGHDGVRNFRLFAADRI